MRTGFLRSQKSSVSDDNSREKKDESLQKLKGLKKKALKTIIIELNEKLEQQEESANRVKKSNSALSQRVIGLKNDLRNREAKYEDMLNKAKCAIHSSFYNTNLDVISMIEIFCASNKYEVKYDDRGIIITFGLKKNVEDDVPTIPYGVWIRDSSKDHTFLIQPFYNNEHTHLKGIPCDGLKVVGNGVLIDNLRSIASRKDEFSEQTYLVPSNMNEFVAAMIKAYRSAESDEHAGSGQSCNHSASGDISTKGNNSTKEDKKDQSSTSGDDSKSCDYKYDDLD